MTKHMARALQATDLAATVGVLAQQAWAQADEPKMHRVEITGSSIKRIGTETALPVQPISRENIETMGAAMAAELVKNISANMAPLTDGASIPDGTSGQRGLNGANLRGPGVSSTPIQLNGRQSERAGLPPATVYAAKAYDRYTDQLLALNHVKYYSLWDLTGSWTVSKQLTARAGVPNLFNADPPFSNHAYFFVAGYGPSYTDPRGRSGFVSVNYSFR